MARRKGNTWGCKIGFAKILPPGSDYPMRKAIQKAYFELTGENPKFLFSGWAAKLSPSELACVLEDDKFGYGDYNDEEE